MPESNDHYIIEADATRTGYGDIVFNVGGTEYARIRNGGAGTGLLGGSQPLPDIPGLVGWWDATDLAWMGDGASVLCLPDKRSGADFIKNATNTAPTKQIGTNGLPVVRFANTGDLLHAKTIGQAWRSTDITDSGYAGPFTMFVVAKASSANTASGNVFVFGSTGAGTVVSVQIDSTFKTPFGAWGATNTNVFGPSLADDAWHIYCVQLSGADASRLVDGYFMGGDSTFSSTDVVKELKLGNTLSGLASNQFIGDIGEIMLFAGVEIPSVRVDAVHAYLGAKWGIAVGSAAAGGGYQSTTSANTQPVFLYGPRRVASPKTLVIWSHPASQNEASFSPHYWAYPFAHAAVQNGWVFAAGRMDGDTWGNTQALADMLDLYNLANSTYSIDKVILLGASMGGAAAALALANNTVPNVAGAYFIDAVLNLPTLYSNVTYTASIDTAYGITRGTLSGAVSAAATSLPTTASFPTIGTKLLVGNGTANVETVTTTGASTGTAVAVTACTKSHASADQVSDYPTQTSGHDPMLVTAASFGTGRFRFIAGSSDTTVPKTTNTDQFQALIASQAAESGIVTRIGGHLLGGVTNPADFVAFVKRCLA